MSADAGGRQAGTRTRPRPPPVLSARGIVKAFPGVVANAGVDLDVRRGEVHALLGENGAGKSTLASVLAGLYQPDAGEIRRDGELVALRSPREALARGIGMVHQHFRLVRRFTVAENVALGDRSQPFRMSTPDIHRDVAELGERYGLPVRPDAVVADLTVGEQQRVEIVKTLYRGVQVLLLDEPTSVLTPQETEALFATVRTMAAEGKAVVFISHKLAEVLSISDLVTVMRDGRVVGSVRSRTTSVRELAHLMVGRDVDLSSQRTPGAAGDPVLELTGVTVAEDTRRGRLTGVSLEVRAGEVVGVAGVSGNGQRPLAEVAAGLLDPDEGRVLVCGREMRGRDPLAARAAGLAYIPEDRLGTGLAPSLSVAENLQLTRVHGALLDRRALARRRPPAHGRVRHPRTRAAHADEQPVGWQRAEGPGRPRAVRRAARRRRRVPHPRPRRRCHRVRARAPRRTTCPGQRRAAHLRGPRRDPRARRPHRRALRRADRPRVRRRGRRRHRARPRDGRSGRRAV
jgi:general nucleoside transport system ATP-binding protein